MASGASAPKLPKTPPKLRIPQHGHGKLQTGNPGNKGGGRQKQYAEERAAQLASDPAVWDKQLQKAVAGDLKPLVFATERAFGKPTEKTELTGQLTITVKYDE